MVKYFYVLLFLVVSTKGNAQSSSKNISTLITGKYVGYSESYSMGTINGRDIIVPEITHTFTILPKGLVNLNQIGSNGKSYNYSGQYTIDQVEKDEVIIKCKMREFPRSKIPSTPTYNIYYHADGTIECIENPDSGIKNTPSFFLRRTTKANNITIRGNDSLNQSYFSDNYIEQGMGDMIRFNGDAFANEINSQNLKKEYEIKIIEETSKKLLLILENSFNFKLAMSSPTWDNTKWNYTLDVNVILNQNIIQFNRELLNKLKTISLKSDELRAYQHLNREYFLITINQNNSNLINYHMRSQESLNLLAELNSYYEYYSSLFQVLGIGINYFGLDIDAQKTSSYLHQLIDRYEQNKSIKINLFPENTVSRKFTWSRYSTMTDLKLLDSISVKPIGIDTSGIKIVIKLNNSNFCISKKNLKKSTWSNILKLVENENSMSSTNWKVPTIVDLELINKLLGPLKKFILTSEVYWSSEQADEYSALAFSFKDGKANRLYKEYEFETLMVDWIKK
jgi:hypothetical protein